MTGIVGLPCTSIRYGALEAWMSLARRSLSGSIITSGTFAVVRASPETADGDTWQRCAMRLRTGVVTIVRPSSSACLIAVSRSWGKARWYAIDGEDAPASTITWVVAVATCSPSPSPFGEGDGPMPLLNPAQRMPTNALNATTAR